MSERNIPNGFDYTNRDFYSLKDDLIKRVKSRVNTNDKQWSGEDPADFGLALVETFAHVGDLVNYYIDRVANEGQLSTATQRSSLLNLAKTYGYRAAGYRQSSGTVVVTNPSTTNLLIPAGTQLETSVVTTIGQERYTTNLVFSTTEDTVAPAAESGVASTVQLAVVHGENISQRAANAADTSDPSDIAGEVLGYSNGLPEQTFVLGSNQVVDGTISVFVRSGNRFVQWSEVEHLGDYGPTDSVYETSVDANNYVRIIFGDGLSGAIPNMNEPIKSSYQVGGGREGNISSGNVFFLSSVPKNSGTNTATLSPLTFVNTEAFTGGEDPETNDSIRKNAPKSLRAIGRAVTLNDYADLALSVSGVGKSAAYAATPTSIALYVAPQVSDLSQDYFPGFNPANTEYTTSWESLKTSVESYVSDRSQIGTTVTVLPPAYTPVHVTLEFSVLPGYSRTEVLQSLKQAIVYGFGFNQLDFKQIIYPTDIERTLGFLNGVRSVRVLELYRADASAGKATLTPVQGEYFVFRDSDITTSLVGGLSALTVSGAGTLSPAFISEVLEYRLTGHASNTITVTPTAANATTTITVNGTTVTSGSASGSISTPSGATTEITVVSTSDDSTNVNSYVIKVIR